MAEYTYESVIWTEPTMYRGVRVRLGSLNLWATEVMDRPTAKKAFLEEMIDNLRDTIEYLQADLKRTKGDDNGKTKRKA